jgi:uncharacterized protein (TIGR02452 family)
VCIRLPSLGRTADIECANETTLSAARRLENPVALNFASAKNPGGGFLSGATAQEESLARASGLYACIRDDPMYAHHRMGDAIYTSWAIYSPAVPVFRDDDGRLLDRPWTCAFLTAPAVNAKVVLERDPSRGPEIRAAMEERIDRVLRIAAVHGHESIVLGAWGCGVFGNDPGEIAELFEAALRGPHSGNFRRVVFAILDRSVSEDTLGPFRRRFA